MEGTLEGNDHAAVADPCRACAHQQGGLDRILDGLGTGVHHEMPWRSLRANPVEGGLETQRGARLVLAVRVAVDERGKRGAQGLRDAGIVLSERARRDQRPHVDETPGLSLLVTIHRRQVGPLALLRIERHGKGVEQAVARPLLQGVGSGKAARDAVLDGTVEILQGLWCARSHHDPMIGGQKHLSIPSRLAS